MTKFKKSLSLLMAAVLALSCFVTGMSVFGGDVVAIDESNFPDQTFRMIVSANYDENSDGYLTSDERIVTLMNVVTMLDDLNEATSQEHEISNIKGVEYFTSVKILRCGGLYIDELDVTPLTNLTMLGCNGNELRYLDLSNNRNLIDVNCSDNNIEDLILPATSTLTKLHCYANQLMSINVSGLPSLRDFRCDQNKISTLYLSNNSMLETMYCSSNRLDSLNLSSNARLVKDGATVTEPMIGGQQITSVAELRGDTIFVPLTPDIPGNVTSSSLDNGDVKAYTGNGFEVSDISLIKDGIDYTYSTGLAGSEDMRVHINIVRDFYQVDFFSDEQLTDKLSSAIVRYGMEAQSPTIPQVPVCKTFGGWSEDITEVTSDMQVYPVWNDGHQYEIVSFVNDIATVTCHGECGNTYDVAFIDCINAVTGDDNYDVNLDVVKDGCINAKDYSQLIRTFK